jgi:hypothetical protein
MGRSVRHFGTTSKPDSVDGIRAGRYKVGILSATFKAFHLGRMNNQVKSYQQGIRFKPRDRLVAWLGNQVNVWLRARLTGPGLIVYQLCLKSDGVMEMITLAAVLRYIVRLLNTQPKNYLFRPVDLALSLRGVPLSDFGRSAGIAAIVATGTLAVRAGWRHFWKAVVSRFAVRGTTAATLLAIDGPLPVGDLIAAGLTLWTVVDVVRFNSELWREAERIAQQDR